MRQFERQHIIYTLRHYNFDKAEAAKNLGIGLSSLYRKLEELGVPKSEQEEPNEGAV
jgi:DNA-binding NtrC family response regulator